MVRRILILFLGVVLVTTLGFGCKGLSAEQQAAVAPITLEYWTVFDDVDAIKTLLAEYKATRPYLTVNVRRFRADEIYPLFVEALAEDRGPDIISVSNRMLGMYGSKLSAMPASVRDTTVRVEKGTIGTQTIVTTQNIPLLTPDQLDREFVQAVKKDVSRGGIIGLPLSFDTMAVYYNKDLLDKAGVPEPPKTWEEFQAAVKKITRYNKQTGEIIQSGVAFGTGSNVPNNDDILYTLFAQSGVTFTSTNGRAVFNAVASGAERGAESPAMNVMNFYTDFANPGRDTYTWTESQENGLDAFVRGSVGFFFGYSYHNPIIRSRAPQLNLGILPLFQLNPENQVNTANYWVQAVPQKSKHPNEAWAVINYLTRTNATEKYLATTARPTALRSLIASQQENLDLQPFIGQVLVADNWYRGNDYDASRKAISDMIHEWLGLPAESDQILRLKQDVLNRAAAKINQTF